MISVIIPVLNEGQWITYCIEQLKHQNGAFEVIVSDGGSTDGTLERVSELKNLSFPCTVVSGDKGRANQLNRGAQAAKGEVLLFLHVDCELPPNAFKSVEQFLSDPQCIGGGFQKKYNPENILMRLYRIMINTIRTLWLRNLVGTNAIFVRSRVFHQLGGFKQVSLLEDVIFCDAMKKAGRMVIIKDPVIVSSRRYFSSGIVKRIGIAAEVIIRFRVLGASPEELEMRYHRRMKKR
ncbi:MAG TPA: TIGR04283 family arsenosugar biosynthesis glycosyltransferase [bacterium]|nr:TIGR04283 family arsenosugar biosynthesis glycosyltransferase [bacterium]HMW33780.1 TIGR04283 family arsenosugar biosynthesis glycosyltransferase [bacterium]HMW35346.1 TIGR04283 family arsenosugar biosynthesis glycosyltransferase [bacterium]HMZ04521.1 TIGR04283 family arsenosugar biosynthesis glycosyltransferase [bacterium]HNB11044.1 TIGR04283 family arsenosugar biosynthesis glycosyltransferase [bacterium]